MNRLPNGIDRSMIMLTGGAWLRMWWVEYEKNLQLVLRFLSDEHDELLELRARVRASEHTIQCKRQSKRRLVEHAAFADAAPISP